MIRQYIFLLLYFFACAVRAESLFDQFKGQSKVTIGTTVTANNMARVITRGPLLGNDFNSQALAAVNELRGDREEALVFVAVDKVSMSATATDWEWTLLYQFSKDKFEREFFCEKKFSVNWGDALWSWQRAGVAFKRVAHECGADFLSFLKRSSPVDLIEDQTKNIDPSMRELLGQLNGIAGMQSLADPAIDAMNQSSSENSNESVAKKEENQASIKLLDVIGIAPGVSSRGDVRARSTKRLSSDVAIFTIGGFDLPCATEFDKEKLSLLICTTGGENSNENIEIHKILRTGFSTKFGPSTLSSNEPVRNSLGVSYSNEKLIWMDSIGNSLVIIARQGKITQGLLALISAEAIQAQRRSKESIDRKRNF